MKKKSSRKEIRTISILLCISLLISFFIGEFLLRALGYYGVRKGNVEGLQLVEDDILDYRLVPNISYIRNSKHYNINKHGWRDYDYDYEKPENTFRILVLGDSVTNGYGINVEEIYAKQLEKKLNQNNSSNIKYECIMLTIGALNTEQEAHLFEIEGLKYNPNLVIIGYVLNDPEDGASLRKSRARDKNESLLIKIKMTAKRSSLIFLIYKSAQKILWKISIAIGMEEVNEYVKLDYYRSLHKDPSKWDRVIRSFKKIKKLSKQNQIKVVLMIFPIIYKLDDYQWADIQKQVTNASLQNGFMVLDLLSYYQHYNEHVLQVANGDHTHPNKFGHQIASDALYEFLYNRDLLPLKTIQ